MRWFINYIRSCFCKHDFEYKEVPMKRHITLFLNPNSAIPDIRVHLSCKKCRYKKTYWIGED